STIAAQPRSGCPATYNRPPGPVATAAGQPSACTSRRWRASRRPVTAFSTSTALSTTTYSAAWPSPPASPGGVTYGGRVRRHAGYRSPLQAAQVDPLDEEA